MERIACVNGALVPERDAVLSIFDRGFLFADGIYEVIPVVGGHLVDREPHLERLGRSLAALQLAPPTPLDELDRLLGEVVARNRLREGRVYLQITRGPADRDFPFPESPRPTLIMFGREAPVLDTRAARVGLRVKTAEDNRWGRCDIKTVMLLPAVLAKQAAKAEGFDDVWFVKAGEVTEGASSNAYIVRDGAVVTRPLSTEILPGCTRGSLLGLARAAGIEVRERRFTVEEAYRADEAFITSATASVTPVIEIDGRPIGAGEPGALTRRLQELYTRHAQGEARDAPA